MPVAEGHCEVPRGCLWPKATVKSPVGAHRRPLWSAPWVLVTFGHYEVGARSQRPLWSPRGCSPKAIVKSPVGARDLRPLWSFISFILSYFLLFSLFHLFPFLFYSFIVFTFFLVYVCFMFFYFYVFIYLFSFYFLFQKDYSFLNMFYNENNFFLKLYFCLIKCRSPGFPQGSYI